jgi:hypothetical protein
MWKKNCGSATGLRQQTLQSGKLAVSPENDRGVEDDGRAK